MLLVLGVAVTSSAILTQPAVAEDELSGTPLTAVQAFTNMRLDYAKRPGYTGGWVSNPQREAALKAFTDHQLPQFISLSKAWLQKCPVDAKMQLTLASALSDSGDSLGAGRRRFVFYGLLMSILSSGDGRSEESAYKVISVDEEYTVMNYLGMTLKQQGLKGNYDVMTVEKDGKESTAYFEISIPLAAESALLNAKPMK